MFRKYSSIPQFRHIVKMVKEHTYFNGKDENGEEIFDYNRKLPTLSFKGYVKLHGLNVGIVFDGEKYWVQSRECTLTPDNDSYNIYSFIKSHEDCLLPILKKIHSATNFKYIVVYGEYFGKGVQKGVGVSSLDKKYMVFDICGIDDQDEKHYLDKYVPFFNNDDNSIINKVMFDTFKIDIDFENVESIVDELTEMTLSVSKQCPVAQYFGIDGVGEGIVFETYFNGKKIRFKSKNKKFSVNKIKNVVPIDVELVNSINEFVEYAVTDNRLKQGIDYMREMSYTLDKENLKHLIIWVINDIKKEESDVLAENKLDIKQVNKYISNKVKDYYLSVI